MSAVNASTVHTLLWFLLHRSSCSVIGKLSLDTRKCPTLLSETELCKQSGSIYCKATAKASPKQAWLTPDLRQNRQKVLSPFGCQRRDMAYQAINSSGLNSQKQNKQVPGPTPSVFTDLQFLQCCARLEFTKLLTHLPHQQADKDQAHSSWPVQPEQLLAWAINTQQSCATSLQLAPSEWVHYLWKNKLLTANGSKVSIMKKYRMGESRGARDCPVSTSCGTNAQDAAHFVISTEGYLFIFLENF